MNDVIQQIRANEKWLQDTIAAETRRKARAELNRAYGKVVSDAAVSMAAMYAFHPDPVIAGREYYKWMGIVLCAPLVSAGILSVGDLLPSGGGAAP